MVPSTVGGLRTQVRVAERHPWPDVARGIGIVLVVFGHVLHGLMLAGLASGPAARGAFVTLYAFHMPLFMVLAGANVPPAMARGRGAFLRRRIVGVGYPYLLWSLVQGLCLVLLSAHTNHRMTFARLLQIGWNPIAQFWFLHALLAYAAVLALWGCRPWVLIGFAALAMALEGRTVPGSGANLLLHHAPFFVAGVIGSAAILGRRRPVPIGVILGWIILFATTRSWIAAGEPYGYLGTTAWPAAVAGTIAALGIATRVRGLPARLLAALGKLSLPIYVLHLFAASGTRILLDRLGIALSTPAHLLIGTIAGIAGPLTLFMMLRHVGLAAVFALEPPRARREGVALRPLGEMPSGGGAPASQHG